MNLQKVIDEEHPRFGQVGEYDRQWVIPGSKPDLHCHTVKFEGGETEQFLSINRGHKIHSEGSVF
jgi:hypothetical protein